MKIKYDDKFNTLHIDGEGKRMIFPYDENLLNYENLEAFHDNTKCTLRITGLHMINDVPLDYVNIPKLSFKSKSKLIYRILRSK